MNAFGKNIGIVFLIVATLVPAAGRTFAQGAASPGIGIVDVQKVLRDSKASKSIRPTIDNMRKEFQKQVSEQEQSLRQAEQELSRQRAILAPEAFAQKRRIFGEQARDAQKSVQKRRRDLDRAFNETKNEILKSLIVVAQKVATEKKLNILIEKRFVFISAKKLDVTDEIIKRLDKLLPTVAIDFSKVGKGDPKGRK
ncbi:MAG: OmpH family outer membrane protein [Rhodospirillaceae bacterium]|nr:MAG: OmpH family outer membrane protein [Rhodospirillaceae bacterium]